MNTKRKYKQLSHKLFKWQQLLKRIEHSKPIAKYNKTKTTCNKFQIALGYHHILAFYWVSLKQQISLKQGFMKAAEQLNHRTTSHKIQHAIQKLIKVSSIETLEKTVPSKRLGKEWSIVIVPLHKRTFHVATCLHIPKKASEADLNVWVRLYKCRQCWQYCWFA